MLSWVKGALTIATPDNAATSYAHDLLGRVVSITDPKGNVQRRELDLLGRPFVVHEPDGNCGACTTTARVTWCTRRTSSTTCASATRA